MMKDGQKTDIPSTKVVRFDKCCNIVCKAVCKWDESGPSISSLFNIFLDPKFVSAKPPQGLRSQHIPHDLDADYPVSFIVTPRGVLTDLH